MKKSIIYIPILIAIIISSCKSKQPDPDTDAVFKSKTCIYELREDGSMSYQYIHKLKYLTHFSFNRLYGDTFIVYNPEHQSLKVNKAVTTMKDGEKTASPENAFNEVLPRFAAGAPDYNHLREMVITHTGLELGCVVDLDYQIETRPDYLPFLSENLLLAENSPVQQMKVVVKVPENITLNYSLLNSEVLPEIKEKNGIKTYTWNFQNLPSLAYDRNRPHANNYSPRLLFSSVNAAKALETMQLEDQPVDKIVKKADEKLTDCESVYDTLFALQQLVANETGNVHVPFEYTGYKTRPLMRIWEQNGATGIEKNQLLASLLQENNIQAKPVFVFMKEVYDEKLGVIKNTGHPYVLADIKNQPLLVSATSTKQKNSLLPDFFDDVVCYTDGAVAKPASTKDKNKITVKGRLQVQRDGLVEGDVTMSLNGPVTPWFDLLKDEDQGKQIVGSVVPESSVESAEMNEWSQYDCSLRAEFSREEGAKKQAMYVSYMLPESSLGIQQSHLDVLTENRTTPLALDAAVTENYHYTIKYPYAHELISGELDTVMQNNAGKVHIKIVSGKEGIEVTRHLAIPQKEILPGNYNEFRELYLLWKNNAFKELVFKDTEQSDS